MILLIDNYDSFSYNLYQLIGSLNPDIKVIRNDELTIKEIEALHPDKIILSPGPGRPCDSGVCEDVIRYFKDKVPILGVCLGHQAIAEVFGATVSYAKSIMHGKQSRIKIVHKSPLLEGMGSEFDGARYHSLAAIADTMPAELIVTAQTDDGEVMALQHAKYPVYGLQFHPESILTPQGRIILKNFLDLKYNRQAGISMIKDAIYELVNGKNLSFDMAKQAMNEIMSGEATNAQIGGFLSALRLKGETIDEITASAQVMREKCTMVKHDCDVLEIVGTGGDEANTFNISTTAGIVVAAGGVAVAKHGNRSVSSKCGAADCLEELGVNLNLDAAKDAEMIKKAGICFMFAPVYHSSMKYAAPVRRELGIRTIFNILGPLANPAGATIQLMGVYNEALVEPLAKVLSNLGVKHGAVVHGNDGLDEITACTKTLVCEIDNGRFTTYTLDPQDYGMTYADKAELVGGDKVLNAQITRDILAGREKGGKRNAVLLNAGMSLHLAKPELSIADGIKLAAELIDSGKAAQKLDEFIKYSNEV